MTLYNTDLVSCSTIKYDLPALTLTHTSYTFSNYVRDFHDSKW